MFDPPSVAITKRVPVRMVQLANSVQQFAEQSFSPSEGYAQRNALIAITLAVWISEHVQAGSFDMSQRDFAFVMEKAKNCRRVLSFRQSNLLLSVTGRMVEAGMFPDSSVLNMLAMDVEEADELDTDFQSNAEAGGGISGRVSAEHATQDGARGGLTHKIEAAALSERKKSLAQRIAQFERESRR
ncbi:hypothetical protein BH11PSE5_BH11PSE5_03440 [soil metagenome]